MGCCFSSTFNPNTAAATETNPENQDYLKRHHSPRKPPILQSQKTPSPPRDDEEEAVIKEVMVVSETPKVQENQQDKITQTTLAQAEVSKPIEEQEEHQEQEQETSHLSQRSEIYTISETISTTTTTATEGRKEDEVTSKDNSKVKHKSPAAKVIKKRPSNGGDSGTVRAPEKRPPHGRGRGPGAMRTVQRNVGSRSRSPATERAGGVGKDTNTIGRSTTTVTGKTDGNTISSSNASARTGGQSKREEDDGNNEVVEQQQQLTESLENPLVSLECFIFL